MQEVEKEPNINEICYCYSCRILKNKANVQPSQVDFQIEDKDVPLFGANNPNSNPPPAEAAGKSKNYDYSSMKQAQEVRDQEYEKAVKESKKFYDKNEFEEQTVFFRFRDLELEKRAKVFEKRTNNEMKEYTVNYQTHDKSMPEIEFHFNPDGSHAIFFTSFCDYNILSKAVSTRNDFEAFYYDDYSAILLVAKKIDYSNYDERQQQFENNQLPLSTFISIKFEEQSKVFHNIGLSHKKQIYKSSTIPNSRLRVDLMEVFECLSDEFEFKDGFASDHCFAYYTQDKDLNILEGLIIGPQDTPYEGIPYTLTIKVPEQYPLHPPVITFNQQILHPNISGDGSICLDILGAKWSSALTIQNVLMSIVSLLYEKNLDDVYNHYAKRLYIEDPEELKKQIRQQAILSGCQNLSINYKDLLASAHLQKNRGKEEPEYEDIQYDDDYNDDYDYEGMDEEVKDDYEVEEEN